MKVDLEKVSTNFQRRLNMFLQIVSDAKASSNRRDADRAVTYVLIEMESAIGYVARSSFLAGSVGGRSASGYRFPGKGLTPHEALSRASCAVHPGKKSPAVPGRDEPQWSSNKHLALVAEGVVPTNKHQLLHSTGVYPDARRCVKSLRNFVAHRSGDTVRAAFELIQREYGQAWGGPPTLAVLRNSISGGGSALETWLWNYRDAAEVLCS
jgi:hypothetical protein